MYLPFTHAWPPSVIAAFERFGIGTGMGYSEAQSVCFLWRFRRIFCLHSLLGGGGWGHRQQQVPQMRIMLESLNYLLPMGGTQAQT